MNLRENYGVGAGRPSSVNWDARAQPFHHVVQEVPLFLVPGAGWAQWCGTHNEFGLTAFRTDTQTKGGRAELETPKMTRTVWHFGLCFKAVLKQVGPISLL